MAYMILIGTTIVMLGGVGVAVTLRLMHSGDQQRSQKSWDAYFAKHEREYDQWNRELRKLQKR